MKKIIPWILAAKVLGQHIGYRLRLCDAPDITTYYAYYDPWFAQLFGLDRRLHILFAERIPQDHALIIASNHGKLDDPFFIWSAIYRASGGKIRAKFVMRDDYFRGVPWDYLPIRMNDLLYRAGAYPISREEIKLSQLKPLMRILQDGDSFIIFPGRTRSRSGLLFEYREPFTEPGALSFFLQQAQRRNTKYPVAVLPVTRIAHPITQESFVTLGEPMYLDRFASSREELRAFDEKVVLALAAESVVHESHVLATCLYLHTLHTCKQPLSFDVLRTITADVLHRVRAPVPPAAIQELEPRLDHALHHLARKGYVQRRGNAVLPRHARILAVPPLDTNYRRRNLVKYLVNQVLHHDDVTHEVERRMFGNSADSAVQLHGDSVA